MANLPVLDIDAFQRGDDATAVHTFATALTDACHDVGFVYLTGHGIDPDIVGNRVLEAVKNGELYVFTHPAMKAFAEMRFAAILSAFDAAAASPALASVKDHAPVTLLTPKP